MIYLFHHLQVVLLRTINLIGILFPSSLCTIIIVDKLLIIRRCRSVSLDIWRYSFFLFKNEYIIRKLIGPLISRRSRNLCLLSITWTKFALAASPDIDSGLLSNVLLILVVHIHRCARVPEQVSLLKYLALLFLEQLLNEIMLHRVQLIAHALL